jgi:glucosamine-phosphate N-acetyltransferase
MSEIVYTELIDLLNVNPNCIETIKENYLLLLSELSSTNYLENNIFLNNVERINKMGSIIVGLVKDITNDTFEIIASGTIIIEPKIMRDGKNVGHIEDIVVAKHMRGKGISSKILDILKEVAKKNDCYKVILDCNDKVKNVYIKNDFEIKGIQMVKYFD